tara:strand:- start:789 stop:1517 length:729 start_codon:yes stop_codon:yes gene_type:complete
LITVNFESIPIKDHDYLLDLGCGEGRHTITAYCYHNISSIGVDLCFKDLVIAADRFKSFNQNKKSKNLSFVNSDGLSLPFRDNSFDIIICSEVLEHIHDYRGIINEVSRLLVPGGTFVVSVPRAWPEKICWLLSREYHEVDGGHIRIFNSKKLKKDIECFGFKCWLRHWAHALHSPYWWLKCLFWKKQNSRIVNLYHKFLIWDLFRKPFITRILEKILNPVMGKSVVFYFQKNEFINDIEEN